MYTDVHVEASCVIVAVAVSHGWSGGVVNASDWLGLGGAEEPVEVPLSAIARFWNAVKECGSGSAGGLMAKTIPEAWALVGEWVFI